VVPKPAARHQRAAAPDTTRYCFVPCDGYPGCCGTSLKLEDQHAFFLRTAYRPPKHHGKLSPLCWDAVRLGWQEHPCSALAGVLNYPHAMPGTVLSCSRDGRAWDGMEPRGTGTGTKEGTQTQPSPLAPTETPKRCLEGKGQAGEVLGAAPRTSSTRSQCLGQGPPGCQGPLSQGFSRCSHGCPMCPPPGSWPPAEHLGEGQVFSSFSPPSLSKMKNLILVFTAPPRWINPFLASPSPGKFCESNAGPSGSHCSNSCFSPAALCKVL